MWGQLTLNVVGGILAAWVFTLWGIIQRFLVRTRFKQVFGRTAFVEGLFLVYEELALKNTSDQMPYVKPGNEATGVFSISRPIPIASVRSISYLASAIGKFSGKTPSVRSDLEVRNLMDIDFVCFGGPASNIMTASCQDNGGNHLALFDQGVNDFVRKSDGKSILSGEGRLDIRFDYGLILKVHPVQFSRRTWVACAGINERGTSGAAWFLANKWSQIREHSGSNPYAALIRVEGNVWTGRDQSTELLKLLIWDGTEVRTIDFGR
jgi:hypothetical protein